MTTRLLLIGHGSRNAAAVSEYYHFANRLASRVRVPVTPCFLEFADPPIVAGIRTCVEAGATHIIALPLFLGPAGHQKNDVPSIINWAKREWPQVQFQYGTPLGAQPQIINVLAQRAEEAITASPNNISPADTALVVVGRGSRDPDSNSEVSKIARMLWEGRSYGLVEAAFYSLTQPDIPTVIDRCAKLGAKRIVVLPYLLFTGVIDRRTGEKALAKQADHPDVEILVGGYLNDADDVIEAVAYRYEQVLDGSATMTCDLCKYRHQFVGFEAEFGMPQQSDHQHGLRGVPHSHGNGQSYDEAIATMLPPRYQSNGDDISAAPMGAADLQYTPDGAVAWDEIWTSFCDLALAGGAPHRGTLLEPVSAEAVRANPEAYEQVLCELERGVKLVSHMQPVRSDSLGWVGIECDSEEMALWLLRAIIVENIAVRREGTTLYLPAGPEFRLDKEIKNVITALAKTYHYWTEHIAYQTQPAGN